jgi:hypothetical protein
MANNIVVATLGDFLSRSGFRKKGSSSWYRRDDDLVTIVNLQKSQYGPLYYLNYGFWLLAVAEAEFPRPEQAHITTRVESAIDDRSEGRLNRLLDLRTDIDEATRRTELDALLTDDFLPLLMSLRSVSDLKARVPWLTGGRFLLDGSAQALLGIH